MRLVAWFYEDLIFIGFKCLINMRRMSVDRKFRVYLLSCIFNWMCV